jgi:splicing factor 3B subunit 3
VSFVNATLVLSIGDTVEEVTDTGFLLNTSTLAVAQMGEDALVQIYPSGIRHIRSDRRVSEWRTAANRPIEKAACNRRQVVISLSGGELVYFELDSSGQLNEFQERKEMTANVLCLSLGPIPEGRQRSRFLAVGCADNTVRMISLDPDSCLQSLSMQALTSTAESLAITNSLDPATGIPTLYLNIGLQNGIFLRTVLDNVTGVLSDSKLRFLGSRPVKLFKLRISDDDAILALSSRPWLSYNHNRRSRLMPLSYQMLEYGAPFSTESCLEGMVAISGNSLR